MKGLSADEVVGQELSILFPESSRNELQGKIQSTLIGEHWGSVEIPILRKDGDIRTALWNSANIYAGDGVTVIATIAQGQDITERKRAEKALRVSHRFLVIANRHMEMSPLLKEFVVEVQNFTGCAAAGLRMLDEEGNIPYEAYAGFSRTFYESESPLSIKSDQCMCINVIKGVTDPKHSFYTKGGSFYMNGTTRFLATVSEEEKGQTRNVCNQVGYESVALVPLRVENRILGLIHVADPRENMCPLEVVEVLEGAAMQLSAAIQRVRAEEALKQSKARLELATAATNIGHWDWDLLTSEVYFSPQWKSQLGYKDHEVPNRFEEWETRLHPDDHDRLMKAVMDYIEDRSPEYALEFRLRHKDGSYRWIYTQADKHFDENGKACRLFGCHIDITERKKIEEELLKVEKLEAVGILAGGIAHDFNNLLAIIMGNISLAKMEVAQGDDLFELLSEAERSSKRAQALTQQLLTFSKGGAPVKKLASVSDVIKETAAFSLRGSNARCEFRIADDLWLAEIDVGQMNQVIQNLVINADHAMPQGGGDSSWC